MAFPALPLPLRRAYGANAFSPATDYSESQSQSDTLWRARSRQDRFRCCPQFPQRSRSEEHTSELQSLTNLVCRLLLEKKKKKHKNKTRQKKQNKNYKNKQDEN